MGERISSKPRGGGRTDRPTGRFLDSTGRSNLGIGICQRCSFKFFLDQLYDDPNIPGLKVCKADRDDYDPYRLPARSPDKINLPFVRPDEDLTAGPIPSVGFLIFINDSAGVLEFINDTGGALHFINNTSGS